MRHFLNGIQIAPRNLDQIGVLSDFTDNPDFLPEPSPMQLYGTDNPTFVDEPVYMDLYGTDNPSTQP